MSGNKQEVICCKGTEDLSILGAERIAKLAEEAVRLSGRFTLSLAGGSTPMALYRLLSSGKYGRQIPWEKVRLFWGDERCVPPDHPDSNYRMVKETLLSAIGIPAENVHRIKGELGEGAAADYEKTLKMNFNTDKPGFPRFDLILLGMGDDGHTASLFPGTAAVSDEKRWVSEVFVERLDSLRISLTPPVIKNAAEIIVLVGGEGKAAALKNVLEGAFDPCRYPAQILRKATGRVTWLVDEAAGMLLPEGFNKVSR
ncbi:MAG: 6-phosphogluconolactonase [bacterium]|nr:6-phosphogluconolactonase [bacterium]